MTTRVTIWLAFVGVLVVALAVFFAMRGGLGPTAESGEGATEEPEAAPQAAALRFDGSWPMFGGGPGLLGRAEGTLADELVLLWRFETGAEVKSSPAVSGGRVFVGSSDASVYAIDLRSGDQLWSFKTEDVVESSPSVVAGRVVVGSADGWLYALAADGGELAWKYETDGEILGAPNWVAAPDGDGAWVLVGSYDNRLHCVDLQTGRAVWTYETDNYVNGSPAVDAGRCVFGGCDALIHVVTLADGAEIAQIDSGSYIAASAAFLDGQVYVGNYDNGFLRADVEPREIVWTYAQGDAPFFSSPAVAQDVLVVGGRDNRVHCIDRDSGKQVWAFKTLGEVNSSPAVCDGKVLVGSDDGRLYMLRLSNGKQIWSYEMGEPIISSPAVAGGLAVVGCDDGYVYAFGPAEAAGSRP
jgi:outer membrane protein assembly factor BamB